MRSSIYITKVLNTLLALRESEKEKQIEGDHVARMEIKRRVIHGVSVF